MCFVDMQPSRMQGQVSFEIGWCKQLFLVGFKNKIEIFVGDCPKDCSPHAQALSQPRPLPLKFHRGMFNVRQSFSEWLRISKHCRSISLNTCRCCVCS